MAKVADEHYEETTCETCGQRSKLTVVPERHKCDGCGGGLDRVIGWLSMNVFRRPMAVQDMAPEELEFCSWQCLLARLRTVECDDFIRLPFLAFHDASAGQGVADFLAELKLLEE